MSNWQHHLFPFASCSFRRVRRLACLALGLSAGLGLEFATCSLLAAPAAEIAEQDLSTDTDLTTKLCRTEESNLANVIVDAIRAVEKSDAAFMHGSAFAETVVPKGKCSSMDLLKAVQYREDMVVIVRLTGAQIRKALENGLKLLPQRSPEFLQVSGITVTIDASAEKDKRVVDVKVGTAKLDDNKTYTVAMPSPLANGALGYYKIWDKARAIDHECSKSVGQATLDYLTGKKSIGVKVEDRLVFKK